MAHDDPRDSASLPPSFTPQGGRPARPPAAEDAITVSGDRPDGPQRTRVLPPDEIVRPEPRIRRQSSREIPVTPSRPGTPPPAQPVRRSTADPASSPALPPRSARPAQVPPQRAAASVGSHGPVARPAAGRPARAGSPPPGGRPPTDPGRPTGGGGGSGFRVRKGRVAGVILTLVLVAVLAWPVGLVIWANGKLQRVEALSGASGTPGTTYLLAGSDARDDVVTDSTEGARTDTIMVLHSPRSGPTSLISLPRDTYAEIPGRGGNKLNAAYSFGGAPLLVETVEGLTGLTVDHYVEVGFAGVEGIVDAVGGVELCYDADVSDEKSKLEWTAGCHEADGRTALAFSRMRYSDPKGDIGRAERQRQVIGAISQSVDPGLLVRPGEQVSLLDAGVGALVVDEKTGVLDLGRLALAFRDANGPDGVTGTPPISNPDYRPGGVGSTVQLDPETVDQFWEDVRDGDLEPGEVGGMPQ